MVKSAAPELHYSSESVAEALNGTRNGKIHMRQTMTMASDFKFHDKEEQKLRGQH